MVLPKFCIPTDLNQSWLDCSTHKYYNLLKFGQDWTETKNFVRTLSKIAATLEPTSTKFIAISQYVTRHNSFEISRYVNCNCNGQLHAILRHYIIIIIYVAYSLACRILRTYSSRIQLLVVISTEIRSFSKICSFSTRLRPQAKTKTKWENKRTYFQFSHSR